MGRRAINFCKQSVDIRIVESNGEIIHLETEQKVEDGNEQPSSSKISFAKCILRIGTGMNCSCFRFVYAVDLPIVWFETRTNWLVIWQVKALAAETASSRVVLEIGNHSF